MKSTLFMTICLLSAFAATSLGQINTAGSVTGFPESVEVKATNTGNNDIADAKIKIHVPQILQKHPEFNIYGFIVVKGNSEIPSQAVDLDGDGISDIIVFVSDLTANSSDKFTIRYTKNKIQNRIYKKRAYAELSQKKGGKWENRKYEGGAFENVSYSRVPSELTDHSYYYRYEGPGWESDKVGYRFYLDWRNAIDIYGKKTHDMVLQNVGLDGYESYHNMSDWGADIFKVGSTLGIGSVAMWSKNKINMVSKTDSVECKILASGPVESMIETKYYGWQVDSFKCNLKSNLSIDAGSRITTHNITLNGKYGKICTGLIRDPKASLFIDTLSSMKWCYIATWGKQSLADDSLGIAVVFKKNDMIRLNEDANNYFLILNPDLEGKLTYKFLAAWEKEPGGINNEKAFKEYLANTLKKLDNPIKVDY
jgi:hypothetical protein